MALQFRRLGRSGTIYRVYSRLNTVREWVIRCLQRILPVFHSMDLDVEAQKRAAAARALEFVRSGMRIGLGTGSTAKHFVTLLGERVRTGLELIAVPTSEATRIQAEGLGIPLTTLDEASQLDLTVDGADEIGPDLTLI